VKRKSKPIEPKSKAIDTDCDKNAEKANEIIAKLLPALSQQDEEIYFKVLRMIEKLDKFGDRAYVSDEQLRWLSSLIGEEK
jgi:hypothetical protein